MRKIISFSAVWVFVLCLFPLFAFAQEGELGGLTPIKNTDRILILAPHPDDEAVGCAGIIQQAVKAGAALDIAYLTNGDHNQFAFIVYEKRIPLLKGEFLHMGEVRRSEAIKAMQSLGLSADKLIFLGYPDFGTFAIFLKHWGDAPAYKSMLTRASAVPYKENLSFDIPYKGESILEDLEWVIMRVRPTKIFVSHPADANADHKALYLFMEVALSDLEKEVPRPEVYTYLVHRVNWPLPRRYHPELPLLPAPQCTDSQVSWFKFDLTARQIEAKRAAILCYKSQTESSAFYLLSFARKNELFSDYLPVNLKMQPSQATEAEDFSGDSGIFVDSDIAALGTLGQPVCNTDRASYGLKGDVFHIRLIDSGKRQHWSNIVFYLFGYSRKTPFAQMPKIRIITSKKAVKVFDGAKALKGTGVSWLGSPKSGVLSVPLQTLGDPDFILTALKAYRGLLPMGATAFRKVVIKQ